MTTCELKPGQSGTIVKINASPAIRQRLLDMGILPSVQVQFERTTLTGDPIWLRVQDYQVSLRREEAESVLVEVNEN
jgi:Fe2+ transport system protein FeoA